MTETPTNPAFAPGEWVWSALQQEPGRIIEYENLWGTSVYRVWLPAQDTVVRVRPEDLSTVTHAVPSGSAHIAYVAAAARVASALAEPNVLLAAIESAVVPLPHQIRTLARAAADPRRVRYLLADEVGLGKTIEAGLIMRELKMRGLVRRTLVVAPKGLLTQWVAEMLTHFGEQFHLIIPGEELGLRRFAPDGNMWRLHNQVVCPLDAVKPIEKRRGWSNEQIVDYNRFRFEDLVLAGWDLVIVDEAHRLAGSTSEVARYKLAQSLADAAPYLLLLTATPHQGKTDGFHRLVELLDPMAFPTIESMSKDRVQPYVLRSEKRETVDAEGQPLFKPRRTQLLPVAWGQDHTAQALLYAAVTDYVRDGYNRAVRDKRNAIGFLMLLMQRLVSSSTRAIRVALERRLEALTAGEAFVDSDNASSLDDWVDLGAEEQLNALLGLPPAFEIEVTEVEHLLEVARQCEARAADVKAETLFDLLYRLQQEEGDPALKLLIFTEFVQSQNMLREFLQDRGIAVTCLNGSMDLAERAQVQRLFAREARVLISTDAGGEGLNLQFCHIVVNFDMPWNPMRIEQRIGRVDRIGQQHPVRAFNLILKDSVEFRVRDVLEEKLARILAEYGVDKVGDVLDSTDAEGIFDGIYVDALIDPSVIETHLEQLDSELRTRIRLSRDSAAFYATTDILDPTAARRLREHPLPRWVERMTINYLELRGGHAERKASGWKLVWPNGDVLDEVVFTAEDARARPGSTQLTLAEARVRGLANQLARCVRGQTVPVVKLHDLPTAVHGTWSLWEISLVPSSNREGTSDVLLGLNAHRFFPIFVHDDGRCLVPSARAIWEHLLSNPVDARGVVAGEDAATVWDQVRRQALEQGSALFEDLQRAHQLRLEQEREKGLSGFAARRRVVERVGLPEVRAHRHTRIAVEERSWREQLERAATVIPEFAPLIIVRIEGSTDVD